MKKILIATALVFALVTPATAGPIGFVVKNSYKGTKFVVSKAYKVAPPVVKTSAKGVKKAAKATGKAIKATAKFLW
jgi:hypothetical protein